MLLTNPLVMKRCCCRAEHVVVVGHVVVVVDDVVVVIYKSVHDIGTNQPPKHTLGILNV